MENSKYKILVVEDVEEQLKAIKDTISNSNSLKLFIGEVETRMVNPDEGALKVAEEIAKEPHKWNIIIADLFMPTPEKGGLLIADKLIECLQNDPEIPVRLILISNQTKAPFKLRYYLPKYQNWIDWYPKHKITAEDYKRVDLADRGLWAYAIAEAIKKLFQDSTTEDSYGIEDLVVGLSGRMRIAKTTAEKIAEGATNKANILILGETGTGKDVFAKFIHQKSLFKTNSLLIVPCAAFPDTLIESELFGYKKGAFAGAYTNKTGKFDDAQNGVIFLDEIGKISPETQPKLLRVLEADTREYTPLGASGKTAITIFNGVVIGATLKKGDLTDELSGRFKDFIYLPPLRDRREDIIPLANHFIKKLSEELNLLKKPLSKDAENLLQSYDWPVNVRELKNIIECALKLSDRDEIIVDDFPRLLREQGTSSESSKYVQKNIASYPPEKFVLSLKGMRKQDLLQYLSEDEIKTKFEAGIKAYLKKGFTKTKMAIDMGYSSSQYLYEKAKEFGVVLSKIKASDKS